MLPVTALFIALGFMLSVGGGVLLWLKAPLHDLLVELCGEEHRARFWGQLYSATVLLTVALARILFPPSWSDMSVGNVLYLLLPMFRAALIGLLACLGVLALTMVRFITDYDRRQKTS